MRIQAILEKDIFQDVATIEVEKDANNRMQVQVVGDVFMYGNNYIYEPIYVRTPIIFSYFWVSNYRPYYSSWNWRFYPSYYYYWQPFPIYKYRRNLHSCINRSNNKLYFGRFFVPLQPLFLCVFLNKCKIILHLYYIMQKTCVQFAIVHRNNFLI